jgi:hypothetical protein
MPRRDFLMLNDGSARRLILCTPKPGTGTGTKLKQLRAGVMEGWS